MVIILKKQEHGSKTHKNRRILQVVQPILKLPKNGRIFGFEEEQIYSQKTLR